jgi:hypothetical protein
MLWEIKQKSALTPVPEQQELIFDVNRPEVNDFGYIYINGTKKPQVDVDRQNNLNY